MNDAQIIPVSSSTSLEIDNAIESSPLSLRLTWTARMTVGFVFNWLREVARGTLCGDLQVRVPACFRANVRFTVPEPLQATVSRDKSGWLRLRCFAVGSLAGEVSVAPESVELLDTSRLTDLLLGTGEVEGGWRIVLENPEALDERGGGLRRKLEESLGEDGSGSQPDRLLELVRAGVAFRDVILRTALPALENKCSAELAAVLRAASEEMPLVDCSFSPTDQGLALYQRTIEGDLSCPIFGVEEEVRWRGAGLALPARDTFLELHMPFLEKREFKSRTQLYAGMEAEASADGGIRVHYGGETGRWERHNTYQGVLIMGKPLVREECGKSDLTISYSDERRLSVPQARFALPRVTALYGFDDSVAKWLSRLPAGEQGVDAALQVSIPAELASVWLELPSVRTASFTDRFSAVSTAVQRSLRSWLSYAYFNDIDRYDDLESSRSLLLYEACRPYSKKKRPDFTYDAMNPASVALALKKSSGALPEILRSVFQLLCDSGRADLAEFYHFREARNILHSVKRGHRLFTGLLAADSYVMDALVKLATNCRGLRRLLEECPQELSKLAHRPIVDCMESIHTKLRRLYDKQAFVSLGALLFLEATRALHAVDGIAPPLKAVLRIRPRGESSIPERVFVNDGWRR